MCVLLYNYRFTPEQHAGIGKYASLHRVIPAAQQFCLHWKIHLIEGTVRSIRDSYHHEIDMRRRVGDGDVVNSLPEREWGRSKLLGNDLDEKVQLYIKSVRNSNGCCPRNIAVLCQRKASRVCLMDISIWTGTGHFHYCKEWILWNEKPQLQKANTLLRILLKLFWSQ